MFPYEKKMSGGVTVACRSTDSVTMLSDDLVPNQQQVLVGRGEIIELIAALTEIAIAKGLLPAKEEPTVSMFDLLSYHEPATAACTPQPEHPFYPLPEIATAAVVIYDAFVTSDGVERHAVAYTNDDGILILEAIGNERSSIEYAQFGTADLRAMLALKEHAQ